MVDIHTHILPFIDDGSDGFEDSLKMLRRSELDGVDILAATPHFNMVYNWLNYAEPELFELFDELKGQAERAHISTSLVLGMEIRAFDGMIELLEKGKLLTLNKTQYVLTEFDEHEPERWATGILKKEMAAGFIPVVAHPERYDFVWEQPWLVCDWLDMGCAIQITRGSLTGRYGPEALEAAEYFMEQGWVTCLASDAHKPNWRTTEMRSGYDYVSERWSKRTADELMTLNPARILKGERL